MSDTLIDWYINRFTWVRISIDSGLKDTYKKIRGTNSFDKIIKNIEKLLSQKQKTNSKTTIGLQIVVNEHNYMNLESHVIMLLNLLPDIDYIQVRPIESLIKDDPYKNFNLDLLNSQLLFCCNKFKIIISNKWNILYSKKFQFSECYASDFIYTIDVHGDVYTCCHVIGNEKYKICNISDMNYFESRVEFLSRVRNKGFNPSVCFYNCRGSGINQSIEEMIKEGHKNFL
jgi:radical SAM protein with 4Fe4S-binding SPASM domain